MSLKDLTREKHELAETTPFMKAVFDDTMPMDVWIDYTFQKLFWYLKCCFFDNKYRVFCPS